MKRRERAIILFIILLLFWGTVLTGPFKYFSWMTRDLGAYVLHTLRIGGDVRIFTAYLFSILCMTGLFILGRTKNRSLTCAVCAVSSLIFYLIQSGNLQEVPLFIAIALALALVSAVLKSRAPEQWLADLFLLSIPVMIVYDALLVPFFSFLKLNTGLFAPWIEIPGTSIFMDVTFLHWPVIVWGILVTVAAIIPAAYFIQSKSSKGK